MGNIYLEFIYWGFVGLINLAASIVVFYTTTIERKHARASRHNDTILRPSRPSPPSFKSPSTGYIMLSLFTGLLNFGGGFLRLRRIHFLELPRIEWIVDLISGIDGGDEFLELLQAKWLVALNDWTSLFLASTFILAGFFNVATVRQIRLNDREAVDDEEQDMRLLRYSYGPSTVFVLDEKMKMDIAELHHPQDSVMKGAPAQDALLEDKAGLIDVS